MPPTGALTLVAAAALAVGGCVTVPVGCDQADLVPRLQCRADLGEKSAQLALAIVYEEGVEVPRDYARAARLYRAAASPTSGTIYVYSPAVGKSPAQVLPLRSGPDQAGLPEAMIRLARLYDQGLGVRRDPAKAAEWRERANR